MTNQTTTTPGPLEKWLEDEGYLSVGVSSEDTDAAAFRAKAREFDRLLTDCEAALSELQSRVHRQGDHLGPADECDFGWCKQPRSVLSAIDAMKAGA
jgi:hypothetical protein